MAVFDSKTLNAKIGGYKLPADFKCLNLNFLKDLEEKSFEDRISCIYNFILGKNLPCNAFDKIDIDNFPASVISVDDGLSVLELFGKTSCNFTDYIFDASSKESEIVSLASVLVSAYVDLCSGGVINYGDKINLASDVSDGRILLALYFCKLIKLPIETLILGTQKPIDEVYKNIFFASPEGDEIDEILSAFFEETEYLLDPVSASGLIAYDIYYSDYEDGNETLILSLFSPFLFSRKLLNTLTGINEISIDKAIKKLSEFTAMEVPDSIESGKTQPFYKSVSEICVKDALEIIKP